MSIGFFTYDAILEAMDMLLDIHVWYYVVIGVLIGVTAGAIPGLTTSTAIALALPTTIFMPFTLAMGFLIGIYKSGIFGGSITAITFGVPGTGGAVATTFDGYPLMKKGRGREALETALYSSVIADTASDLITIMLASLLAVVALAFGPAERFAVTLIGFVLISALAHESPIKGLLAAVFGVILGMVGADPVGMRARMTFGLWWLSGGLTIVPVTIGLFAVSGVLHRMFVKEGKDALQDQDDQDVRKTKLFGKGTKGLAWKDFRKCFKAIGIGLGIGSFCGALPGLGAITGSMLSYAVNKKFSKNKEIGSGALEGVAAAEAGNNATVGPTLVPLLVFGIPGSTVAALIGAALLIHGFSPSPRLFEVSPGPVLFLFLLLIGANFVNLIISRFLLPVYCRIGQLPERILNPIILCFAVIGSYISEGSVYDVFAMLSLAIIGLVFRVFKFPIAPLLLAFFLSPLLERNYRRALAISGSFSAAFSSPLSIGLLLASVIMLILVIVYRPGDVSKKSRTEEAEEDNSSLS